MFLATAKTVSSVGLVALLAVFPAPASQVQDSQPPPEPQPPAVRATPGLPSHAAAATDKYQREAAWRSIFPKEVIYAEKKSPNATLGRVETTTTDSLKYEIDRRRVELAKLETLWIDALNRAKLLEKKNKDLSAQLADLLDRFSTSAATHRLRGLGLANVQNRADKALSPEHLARSTDSGYIRNDITDLARETRHFGGLKKDTMLFKKDAFLSKKDALLSKKDALIQDTTLSVRETRVESDQTVLVAIKALHVEVRALREQVNAINKKLDQRTEIAYVERSFGR